MAHQIFLSHATEDRDTAVQICAALEAEGIGCWLPSRDAIARKDKAAANLQAIRNSDLVLLVFSGSANASPTVLRDIERAIGYERPVLSLHLDDAVPNASLEYYLNLWQWLDASRGLEEKGDDIVAAVREQLAGISDSATWRGLDSPGGGGSKQEEISDAGRGDVAPTLDSAESEAPGVAALTRRRRPRRRTWAIALGAALVALALGLGLGLGLTGTGHQSAWTKVDPAGTLPWARAGHLMVYDPPSGRLIIFAGGNNHGWINDTWAYDPGANTWTELKPSGTVPSPRADLAMAYDPITRRLILFGGQGETADKTGPYNDTWAYDSVANAWTELKPAGTLPPPRVAAAMAYDPATKKIILFGGWSRSDTPGYFNDTWAYDSAANTWAELKPSGTLPLPSCAQSIAYDPSSGRMILFGGAWQAGVNNDTRAYDPTANTWTKLRPEGTLPSARAGSAMAYDESSHRMIMFGGGNDDASKYFDDTWAYDPVANTWTELKPSGALPGARYWPSLAYVPSTGKVVLFGGMIGGSSASVYYSDLWSFVP
jgi:N-acetylneuraminic acid mutarotase